MLPGDPHAFDDDGRPVPSVEFDFDEVDREPDAIRADEVARVRQETLARFLALLTDGEASTEAVGRRALLLAAAVRPGSVSCRALGQRLGVSGSRAAVLLTAFRRKLIGLTDSEGPRG